MERIPEPELMSDPEQARAYAEADFAEPHGRFVAEFRRCFPAEPMDGWVLDLGCGPGDIVQRFARAFPACRVDGVDGAEAMLAPGRQAIAAAGLTERVRLIHGYLPHCRLPRAHYDAVISNSLLHHLNDPMVLWAAIESYARPGAPVFVMDLLRPGSPAAATALVEAYAGEEPEILRRDFYHSLLAAYRPEEIEAQLVTAGMSHLDLEVISDRHWLVSGRTQPI
jgi:ubiquinone/menaquinone biosynthesis C-methylase UbiE